METNNAENDNQIEIFHNDEDNENNNSHEENLNKDILNQDTNDQKNEPTKEPNKSVNNNEERRKIRKFPSKEVKIPKKIIHNQKKTKKKNNVNPFLSEGGALENSKFKKISNSDFSKNSGKVSYLYNYKNDTSEVKDSSINKTVFSKISENMYKISKEDKFPIKKARNLEQENEETYNKLTEEAFLCSCANKANKENKKIIYEFLDRKKKQQTSKKIGIDLENKSKANNENELESLKDIKRLTILTDRNRSYKSSRTFHEFLLDQKKKQEIHENHLKTNENLKKEEMDSKIQDRPHLNEETVKLANNINRNTKANIHSRLYKEFNDKMKKEEEKVKEKHSKKSEEKKLSKIKINENIERLFSEYQAKNKRISESEVKKQEELKNLSSNHTTSKNSNDIIFKRFKNILVNSFKDILQKDLEENFEITYSDFLKILHKINFTTKNYFELIENKNKSKDMTEDSKITETTQNNRNILRKYNFEAEKEYKLSIDAWKIIIKSKEFKEEAPGESKRILLFFLSTLGIFNGNADENFFKKEFLNIIKDISGSISNYSNLSKQIYKYFSIYRNNAINGLLFRDKDQKRREEFEKETERNLTFTPMLEKSSREYLNNNHSVSETRLSVEKNYDQYRKNKELKLREKEKLLEKEEKQKCPFVPYGSKNNEKINASEISQRLYKTGLKHLKSSSSTPNNFLNPEKKNNILLKKLQNLNQNYHNIQKMFDNNPLEKDIRVQKKIKEMKESRNKKSFEKLIKKKGFKPKEDFNKTELYDFDELYYKNGRFALDDEPLNTFKNTFNKYERHEKKLSEREKYAFEIMVDRKPQKLIIYQGDDISCKVKDFCSLYKLDYNDKQSICQAINTLLKEKNNFYE
jgi:hypothetical protein